MNIVVGLLTLVLAVPTQSRELSGTVVDDRGKPVAGAAVVFKQSAADQPANPQTRTDAAGRFRLSAPIASWGRVPTLWVYQPGLALAAVDTGADFPATINLRAPLPRTITIEGPDGKPIAGAKVGPEAVVFVTGHLRRTITPPIVLAESLAATTGADGKVTFDCIARLDQLDAVYVSTPSIGRQILLVSDEPLHSLDWTTATVRLKATSRLTGTVKTAAGQPCAGVPIAIYSRTLGWLAASPVEFDRGPVRTAADGSFQTPDNLLVGVAYRALVRAPGMEPALSGWITIGEKPHGLPPLVLRPLGKRSGRVVDRQGKPVAGFEVFQSGDGPQRTSTLTDGAGRFTLGGFCQGPVFVFAHGEGIRFSGRLIKPGEDDVTLEVTRSSQPPDRPMRMLPEPIPPVESRALAHRLIEPEWKSFDARNDQDKFLVLRTLVSIDPFGALRKADSVKLPASQMNNAIRRLAVEALARTDAAEAETLAETIDEPGVRSMALLLVANELPDTERAHKLALLERATVQARSATRPQLRGPLLARVINRLCSMGEKARARALLPEVLELIKETGPPPNVAAMLARVDLAAALQIANEVATKTPDTAGRLYTTLAREIAAESPAEAERVWSLIRSREHRERGVAEVAWKIAEVDPERAWRLTDTAQSELDNPLRYLWLAHGLRARDPAGARRAFQTAMEGLDRRMAASNSTIVLPRSGVTLPMVEQIDPALLPEYFWRTVAMRPARGEPSDWDWRVANELVLLLAWYDRDVAAALFERTRVALNRGDDLPPAVRLTALEAWSVLDPRAAVAHLEKAPVERSLRPSTIAGDARLQVANYLALPQSERWRDVYLEHWGWSAFFGPGF
jgi:hypothetical protein